MKKTLLLAVLLLSACEQLSFLAPQADDKTPLTTKAKLHACVYEEAKNKVMDGSVFSLGLSATASEVSGTCIKKLALESAGLDTQTTSEAKTALQTLMDAAKNATAK